MYNRAVPAMTVWQPTAPFLNGQTWNQTQIQRFGTIHTPD